MINPIGYDYESPTLAPSPVDQEDFAGPDGRPVERYLQQVRSRFGQRIRDTCTRARDDQWLAYQHEIAQGHTRAN